MNFFMKKQGNMKMITNMFYKTVLRNKFRRLTQPGYTRYNMEGLGSQNPVYEVNTSNN